MPITRKQFELGIDSRIEECMRRIQTFLALHEQEAFTAEELEKALGLIRWAQPGERDNFNRALDKLVGVDAVTSRIIAEVQYYARGPSPLEF